MKRLMALAILMAACDSHSHDAPPVTPPPVPAGVTDTAVGGKARDVVCGMEPATAGAQTSDYKSTRYYFCSADCKAKFDAAPADHKTGQPGETCVCSDGGMSGCKCGHCTGKAERCACWDPKKEALGDDGHEHP